MLMVVEEREYMDWAGQLGRAARPAANTGFWGRDPLLADIGVRLKNGSGFSIVTLNLDHVVKLREDAAFRAAYAAHSHVTADGHPIVWLERLAGRRAERVAGSDLVLPLARIAAEAGAPVAFLGSTSESLAGAEAELSRRVPGLRVALQIAPPHGFDPASETAGEVISALGRSDARLCFVALGAPRQELFAARAQVALPHMGFASVGAGLDFLSGHQVRAPAVLQALALEWLWRLARDPGRMTPRYARCGALLPSLAISAIRRRGSGGGEVADGAP
jgi:exopolysaccharide biosynthesis WecB/TagA/CpsF family protein